MADEYGSGVATDTARVLTSRELNRALLARQLLLDRAADPLPTVLERMAGLQAQYAPAIYLGLWSRAAGVARDAVTELLETRAIIQGTLLRSTIHAVSRADYWPTALAVRAERRRWQLRANRGTPSAEEFAAAAEKLRDAIAASGPMRQAEIDKLLGPGLRGGAGLWVDLVRVPPSGTWNRRRADLYHLADEWVGPPEGTAEAGVDLLVRRYLTGFGPATRKDVATWAGLPVATVAEVLDRLPLRHFRDEAGADLVDLPRLPLPDADTPAPVRFLPNWDASLLVHARRSGILPEQYRPRIFHTRAPQSFPTFLVDGAVAGTWRYADGRVTLEEFHPQPASVRKQLRAEAERLEAFHA
jgi:winged helix DNA-binding protein